MRNPQVPLLAERLREQGYDVFDDWYAAGPEADDKWRDYERARQHSYGDGLRGYAAQHVYEYDRFHLDRCDLAVLLLPTGRSGHLELGYFIGKGKPGFILLEPESERWDVMYKFATAVVNNEGELFDALPR